MKSIQQKRGSTVGAVIAVLVILGVVAFAGVRLNQSRTRLMVEVDGLQRELTTAQTRIGELQDQVNTERTAREQAEATAKEVGTAAVQAREELQSQQEKLNARIQELEASAQQYAQQIAAAEEMKTKAEAELARETERRKAVEQEIADARSQLEQQSALASQQPGPAAASPEIGSDVRGRAATDVIGAESAANAESRAAATTAAKQNFPRETPADAMADFDTPPKPLDLVSPEYPKSLRQQGTEGNVVVAFTVDTRGRVQDVEVQEATNGEFEAAALVAVRKWRFKPAIRDGQPVEVRISQRLNFKND